MTKRTKGHVETMELFDPTPYYVEPEHDDAEDFWVPPATVHNFGLEHLLALIDPRAKLEAPKETTNRLGGMVLRFQRPDRPPTLLRIRDARKLEGDHGEHERLYQVTLRKHTASGAVSGEWEKFQHREYDLYGYAWANVTATGALDLEYAVILDVAEMMKDLEPGVRPGVFVRNPKDGKELYRAPGGERFYAIDLRHLRPETVVRTFGFTVPHVEPDPVLM